jgi:hypothetical protein
MGLMDYLKDYFEQFMEFNWLMATISVLKIIIKIYKFN